MKEIFNQISKIFFPLKQNKLELFVLQTELFYSQLNKDKHPRNNPFKQSLSIIALNQNIKYRHSFTMKLMQRHPQEQQSSLLNQVKQRSPQKSNNFVNNNYQNSFQDNQTIRIGEYKIIKQVRYKKNCSTKSNSNEFKDFICIRDNRQSPLNSLKNSNKTNKKNTVNRQSVDNQRKQELTYLCRVYPLLNNLTEQYQSVLVNLINSSKSCNQQLKMTSNIIFPAYLEKVSFPPSQDAGQLNEQISNETEYVIQWQKQQFYLPVNIQSLKSSLRINYNSSPSKLTSFQANTQLSFLSKLARSSNIKSELYCLNLLYHFLIDISKPLMSILQKLLFNRSQTYLRQRQIIIAKNLLFNHILVEQNFLVQEGLKKFYFFFVPNRLHSTTNTFNFNQNIVKLQTNDVESLEKAILSYFANLLWNVFYSNSILQLYSQNKNNSALRSFHTTFLKNFLFSLWEGKLKITQAISILQSKQKRKSFITQTMAQIEKQVNNKKLNNDQMNGKGQENQESLEFGNFDLYNTKSKRPHKKSIHRRLNEKRNTLDPNYYINLQQSNIPPGFYSRSKSKKNRLFRHQSFKGRQRRIRSYYDGNQENYSSLAPSTNGSPNKQRNRQDTINNVIRNGQNFSFMRNSTINKFNNKNVSKTIDVSHITQKEDTIIQKRLAIDNFIKPQHKYSANQRHEASKSNFKGVPVNDNLFQKSKTDKVVSGTYQMPPEKSPEKSPVKQNLFAEHSSIKNSQFYKSNFTSKYKNRRYFHLQNPNQQKNQSIQALIQIQKKLHEKTLSKSKQKQLLNRSQEKALALFNRQFGRSNNKNKQKDGESQQRQQRQIQNAKNKIFGAISEHQLLTNTKNKVPYHQNQLKSLLKSMKNNNNYRQRNYQTKYEDIKSISYDEQKLYEEKLKEYSNKSKQFLLNDFGPPKRSINNFSNTSHEILQGNNLKQGDLQQNGMSPLESFRIDDSEFRSKFNSILVYKSRTSSFNRNSIYQRQQKGSSKIQTPLKQSEQSNNYKKQISSIKQLIKQKQKLPSNHIQNLDNMRKVQNQYILAGEEQGFNKINKSITKKQNQKRDIQSVFREQSLTLQKQTQLTTKKQKFDSQQSRNQEKLTKDEPLKNKGSQNVQEKEQRQKLKQQQYLQRFIGSSISPIPKQKQSLQSKKQKEKTQNKNQVQDQNKLSEKLKSNFQEKTEKTEKVEKVEKIEERVVRKDQKSLLLQEKEYRDKIIQKPQKPKFTFKPKAISNEQQNELMMNPFEKKNEKNQKLDSDDLIEIIDNLKEPKTKREQKDNLNDSKMNQIAQNHEIAELELQMKKRKSLKLENPLIQLKKNISLDRKEKKVNFSANDDDTPKNSVKKTQQRQTIQKKPEYKNSFSNNRQQSKQSINSIYSQKKNSFEKKSKQVQQQQLELQQIKLVPNSKLKPSMKHQQSSNKVQQSKPNQSNSKPPLPSNNIQNYSATSIEGRIEKENPAIGKKRKPSQQEATQTASKKKDQQREKQHKRQNTGQSSVASSFGPNKTVKKMVQQFVFVVNKIGQAVAKTPKVSKKLENVVEWYVGVYFLYKRFLYERKRIQKWLKDGVPKLTRYDQQFNLDEWNIYLKSQDRQNLIIKVSQQNISIGKSIQKMQKRLIARSTVPQSVKQHAAISQRSQNESRIAIDGVIDEFDILVEKGLINDEQILLHCNQMLNACLIVAELDKVVDDIIPISELTKVKRTPQELQNIAQDLFDYYHDE